MKVIVNISLKEGVLDPEGQAIKTSLSNLGFENLNDVRTGKQIILNFVNLEENEAVLEAKKMCEDLLVNSVIEKYKINILRN
ncbi:phosphoribosylformylglycinamidine synthase subunit PurS [Alphaproteobacteria bacterium]|nr:phosphoribosylformylglycinamidine synthase subunit PurS [Alphaproteobacteria bacterium]|tara:strand:+ start:105 stop:350 length:246 start_codon:yes stop_codon:yes gene_type:complete